MCQIKQPIVNLDGRKVETLNNFISMSDVSHIYQCCPYEIALEATNPCPRVRNQVRQLGIWNHGEQTYLYKNHKIPQDTPEGWDEHGVLTGFYKGFAFRGKPDNWSLEIRVLKEYKPRQNEKAAKADGMIQCFTYSYFICKLSNIGALTIEMTLRTSKLTQLYGLKEMKKTEEYLDTAVKWASGESPIRWESVIQGCWNCHNKIGKDKVLFPCPHDAVFGLD